MRFHTLLSITQQMDLASSGKLDDRYCAESNARLAAAIDQVQSQSPTKFHTADTLSTRQFFNEPKELVPMYSYVKPYKPMVESL